MRRPGRNRAVFAPLLIAAGAVGCDCLPFGTGTGDEESAFLATIWGDAPDAGPEERFRPLVYSVPDTVDAGEPFVVTIRTYYDCREEKGSTRVQRLGDQKARVFVYTRRTGSPHCVRGGSADHTAEIQFERRGWADLTLVGEHRFGYLSGPLRIVCRIVVRKEYTVPGAEGGCHPSPG
ncbi:hypothetical protein [Candidatus Palauibacter sp.]|uniref:hypothetical protein n=1 Tax=Candidatus Palauibacter sp. TaxID=3101350 RepID=UPI003B01EF3B